MKLRSDRKHRLDGSDRGTMVWVVIMTVLLFVIASIIISAAMSQLYRSRAATENNLVSQRVATGKAAALEKLTSGLTLPSTHDTGLTDCQTVSHRPLCNLTWATPIPGTATDPTRYDLLFHTWLDQDRDGKPPASGTSGVRATLVPAEAITYQDRIASSGAAVKPRVITSALAGPGKESGYVEYPATPLALFGNAIHGFSSVTLSGGESNASPADSALEIGSYNSVSKVQGTKNGAVSSDGPVAYGPNTKVDRTVLFGGAGTAGDFAERCTGEACGESDVRVLADTHAAPTVDSEDWILNPTACNSTFTGDWRASEHAGSLPAGVTCVLGNVIIDAPTTRSGRSATLYVYGNVIIEQSLNAPAAGTPALPGDVQMYVAGTQVMVNSTSSASEGIAVAALIYAPTASCANKPVDNKKVTYYGSLVCDTISLAGPWTQWYDEAQTVDLSDPVPGAKKVWTVGPEQRVDEGDHLVPENWDASSCTVMAPANAGAYWKLDEQTGNTAHDSSTNGRDAIWNTGASRQAGICAKAAPFIPSGAVTYATPLTNSTTGMSVQWWANNPIGIAFEGGGVRIEHTSDMHVKVTSGGVSAQVPFTVQNADKWHWYAITISPTGVTRLFVDGVYKDTVTVAAPEAAGGPVTLGAGTRGLLDEVAYFPKELSSTDIANRWTGVWTQSMTWTSSFSGTPIKAPTGVADDGTTASTLKMTWMPASGTISGPGTTPGSYVFNYSTTSTGPWTQGPWTAGSTATSLSTSASVPAGMNYYRVCMAYNGDQKCSVPTPIITILVPNAPFVRAADITTTTARFFWPAVSGASTYEIQYRVNGGAWSATVTNPASTPEIALGPTTQGTLIEVRVRSVNAAGASAWSSIARAELFIQEPGVYGWATSASFPYLYARIMNVSCPAGTVPQSQYRDKATSVATWNGWQPWVGQDAYGAATAQTSPSLSIIGTYLVGADVNMRVRCYNPASGIRGSISGPHGVQLWQPLPAPTGMYAWVSAYRTVSWGGTCPAELSWRGDWWVSAAWGATGQQGVGPGSWSNTGPGWGNGSMSATAVCYHPARGSGPTATYTSYF